MHVTNPATEEIIATLSEDTSSTLQEKFTLLKKAQKPGHSRLYKSGLLF